MHVKNMPVELKQKYQKGSSSIDSSHINLKLCVWGGLTNSCEKKRSEKQRRKGKIFHLNAEFQRITRRDRKAFLSNQCKEIQENKRMGKTRDLFEKIRDREN